MSEDAEDAFGALADETRVSILRELWNVDDPLTFSELRDRVGVADSGRFNYHLGKVRGRFVEQREDGYALRFAGRELVGALHSGVFTEEAAVGPNPVDGECSLCDGPLEAVYEDERGRVTCTECGGHVISTGIPPAFVDGREDDLAAAIDGYVRTVGRQFAAGYCSACRGRTAGRLEDGEEGPRAVYECERCGGQFHGFASIAAVDHAAVLAFYHDHGRNARDIPVWEMDWLSDVAFDGDHAVATVELDGDELRVEIDERLDVVATERR